MMSLLVALAACSGPPETQGPAAAPTTIPWSGELPSAPAAMGERRGLTPRRTIVHLHSPWSHDACDGEPMPDGSPDPACLADLRRGLCAARVDVAFLTDHPDYAAFQTYDALVHPLPGDEVLPGALRVTCDDGHVVTWLPGIEDELMPVGLDRQVAGDDFDENHRLYNGEGEESVLAEVAAGAAVFVAHTEGREADWLAALQDLGVTGVEIFNLHAMFDPTKREEDLGLDGLGWVTEVDPFFDPAGTAEPDLYFLAVLAEQAPSVARWDELLARGPMVGVAGTDAHQNVWPMPLRDGERGDSYRRSLRWFSNVLLTDADTPDASEAALAAGRLFVAFEALGTPAGFDVHLIADDGAIVEMGGEAAGGDLVVACPTLAAESPRGPDDPEITVRVLRDGAAWRDGCGTFPVEGAGAYRVVVDIVPRHLAPFLGDDPDPWIRSYPWLYSNALRVAPVGSP